MSTARPNRPTPDPEVHLHDPDDQFDRQRSPWHDLAKSDAAERCIIGSLLWQEGWATDLWADASARFTADDFTDPAYRLCFEGLGKLHEHGESFTPMALATQLAATWPTAWDFSPASFLAGVIREMFGSAHYPTGRRCMIESIEDRQSKLIEVDAQRRLNDGESPIAVQAWRGERYEALAARFTRHDPSASNGFEELVDAILAGERDAEHGSLQVAPSGSELNQVLIGRGYLTVVAAPPGAGKTALVNQLLYDALQQEGQRALRLLNVNVEMIARDLQQRQIARHSRVPLTMIQARSAGPQQREMIREACLSLQEVESRIWHFAQGPFYLDAIRAAVAEFNPDVVLIDYLQKIQTGVPGQRTIDRVDQVLLFCREIAKQGRAVVAISSVNRPADGKGYRKGAITMTSLRESGNVEFDSDSIYILDRQENQADCELRCEKLRHGEPRNISLEFDGKRQEFMVAGPQRFTEFDNLQGDYPA